MEEGSIAQIYLEDAIYYQKNGNLEYALNYYRLVKENSREQDSIPYWTKAIIGEGKILIAKSDYKGAKRDFTELLSFAKRKKLLLDECLAWQRLGQVALAQFEPVLADSCYRQALQLSKKLKKDPLPYLKEEAVIAEANYQLLEKGGISDSIYQKLLMMYDSKVEGIKVASLKLLAIHAAKMNTASGGKNWLSMYIAAKDESITRQFQEYSELQEHEKAQLVLERDKQTKARQLTLFLSIGTFALLICVGIYIMISYRRRHELDRIQRILAQKELEIYQLEKKNGELNEIRILLQESERAVTELENKNRELDKIRMELKDKEEQVDELKEHFKDINQMREQIRRKEKELKEMEERLLAERFHRNSKIAARIPSSENPVSLSEKDFSGIFYRGNNYEEFLIQYNKYYNNFAARLQDLNPKLNDLDLVYCCLFRMNVKPSDIALMFGVSRNTVSMRRKRIEEKMEDK